MKKQEFEFEVIWKKDKRVDILKGSTIEEALKNMDIYLRM